MRRLFVALRIGFATATLVAIVAQLRSSTEYAAPDGDTTAVVVNFFSYFTVDSNTLTVIMLGFGAWCLLRSRSPEPGWFTIARAAVTTYMVITGIVYNLLLRAEAPSAAIVGWSNEILHVIGPATSSSTGSSPPAATRSARRTCSR